MDHFIQVTTHLNIAEAENTNSQGNSSNEKIIKDTNSLLNDYKKFILDSEKFIELQKQLKNLEDQDKDETTIGLEHISSHKDEKKYSFPYEQI